MAVDDEEESSFDDAIRDEELPDRADWSRPEEASVDLEPCPFCGKAIYEDVDICHHCGSYVAREPGKLPVWSVVIIVLLLIALGMGYIYIQLWW